MYLCVYVCMYINKDICIYVYIQISHRPRVIRKHAYMRTCPFCGSPCIVLRWSARFLRLLGTQLSGAHERKEGGWQWVGGRERERERERERKNTIGEAGQVGTS